MGYFTLSVVLGSDGNRIDDETVLECEEIPAVHIIVSTIYYCTINKYIYTNKYIFIYIKWMELEIFFHDQYQNI